MTALPCCPVPMSSSMRPRDPAATARVRCRTDASAHQVGVSLVKVPDFLKANHLIELAERHQVVQVNGVTLPFQFAVGVPELLAHDQESQRGIDGQRKPELLQYLVAGLGRAATFHDLGNKRKV